MLIRRVRRGGLCVMAPVCASAVLHRCLLRIGGSIYFNGKLHRRKLGRHLLLQPQSQAQVLPSSTVAPRGEMGSYFLKGWAMCHLFIWETY